MSRRNYGVHFKPCLALVDDMEDGAQFETMKKKMHEELSEFDEAIEKLRRLQTTNKAVIGKHREHALEEGIDAMTAVYTTLRLFATDEEIQREADKVIIKNDLRGYTDTKHTLNEDEESRSKKQGRKTA